ncbi:MAG TPA: peptide deformylase [Campylobacterales bacterium]|nr:peptide deformylase [Campylobacterales bacterium]
MIREVVIYPDKRLKLISREVTKFDDTLHTLLDDMYDTMIAKKGVGLAAIQVGVDLRALIINIPDEESDEQSRDNTLEIINPHFLSKEGYCKSQEGCLSVPGVYEDVERAQHVKITYQDRHGNTHEIDNDAFLAIAIQHEVDHLDGKVFVEKLSYTKRKKFEKEWKKRQK